ncbi:diphthine--ammonia ligase [Jeotgalibacillus sp. S-D1]|uniref:Dph6-related ATP pyrophosphatase n=1 Tax=Jeotgalibacillus sp. S-D1 TaxID=2552189 RepID=UPI001F0E2391|nr:diphthine--ammonia ligase [Jeotgalibacillus sp. S-D1]
MITNHAFFSSWSGGKDSTLAYFKACKEGGIPKKLLTMFEENEERSRSHALPLDILKAQAESVNVPLIIKGASWGNYEEKFLEALAEFKEEGISHGVFGDIDLEDHLKWVEDTCEKEAVTPHHPLWKMDRRYVLEELLREGFECVIIVVKDEKLPQSFLGKTLTKTVINEIEEYEVDACGEEGEFHTVVVDGPNFTKRIELDFKGIHQDSGYSFLNVSLKQ